ncbi:max dimerization protein 4 isoform X2 [Chanodichthys erythropterus]|uniref:max dimerization protein 4 isoform X2 n=1 Tax=Chanodichthys erythropterus TaxID=933992 RepID=UPI00351EDB8B
MELNSLLLLLEAAEYLERRDRAEHGYASVLPYDSDFSRKKTKSSPISRKNHNNRSSHNELEKHRRAKLRLYLEQLKQLVPLGPDSTRHTTLSLLKRAKMHIKKLEEQDRKALNMKEQLQREHRYLKRRLEQLSVQGLERIRTDSMGSTISTDSEQEVDIDIEGMEFTPVEDLGRRALESIINGSSSPPHPLPMGWRLGVLVSSTVSILWCIL